MEYLLSILITAGAYLLVPAGICLSGAKLRAKKIMRIAVINAIVVYFVFAIIRAANGTSGSGASVFLWYYVAHSLMKNNCLAEEPQGKEVSAKSVSDASAKQVQSNRLTKGSDIAYKPEITSESPQKITSIFCARCGKAHLPQYAFCPHCGEKNMTTVTCHVCKNSMRISYTYCPICGTKNANMR